MPTDISIVVSRLSNDSDLYWSWSDATSYSDPDLSLDLYEIHALLEAVLDNIRERHDS